MLRYEIKCKFCNKVNGYFDVPDNAPNPLLEIEDSRCDQHAKEHGDYKELEERFIKETKLDRSKFLEFIQKAEFKKGKLDIEIDNIKKDKIKKLKNVII